MRTRVKICCIANLDEAKLAIDSGADALGFVGRMQTGDRQIPDEQIAAIAAQIPPPIATFLLTSEHTAEGIAGGLTPMNVERAIRYVRPFGVDLCNGVRTSGRLDPARLAAFVSAVRAADRMESSADAAIPRGIGESFH
jgi:phosphoribosylanthranilate isomerase